LVYKQPAINLISNFAADPMQKNKYLSFIVFLLIVVAGYFLTAAAFPKT
jgi:hypothetical protein